MNGVKPIKIDKFIGTAIELVWMLYIAIGSNWKFLLSAKIVRNGKYYIGLICWCATFVVVPQNLLMCILNREILCTCTARAGTASGMSINFSAIMEVGNIEREKNHSTNDIYRSITSTSSFWPNENSYWIERQRHFFRIDSEHQIVNAWQADSG